MNETALSNFEAVSLFFEKWRGKDTEQFTKEDWDNYGDDVNESNTKYQDAWEAYLKENNQSESEALASFSKLVASVSSRTRSKLSLRSSASNTPSDQAPSTRLAEITPLSQTPTLPSDESIVAKKSISDDLIPTNIGKENGNTTLFKGITH